MKFSIECTVVCDGGALNDELISKFYWKVFQLWFITKNLNKMPVFNIFLNPKIKRQSFIVCAKHCVVQRLYLHHILTLSTKYKHNFVFSFDMVRNVFLSAILISKFKDSSNDSHSVKTEKEELYSIQNMFMLI